MAAIKSPPPKTVIYKTVAEFSAMLHETFDKACREAPDDLGLKRVRDEIAAAEAEGNPQDGEAALRKWYSKRRLL